MLINEQTKISYLLKHSDDALEKIIELSPDFKKLRNPVLRKLMAGRTSIAMAAKIGGCTPEDFFRVLMPLGFTLDTTKKVKNDNLKENSMMPEYLKNLSPNLLIEFDVRSILAGGEDPLKQIQEKVRNLKAGEVLKIINTFEPVPLIKLLEKKSYKSYVEHKNSSLVETYFYKSDKTSEAIEEPSISSSSDWNEILAMFENKLRKIDVRDLEMPQPMLKILGELDNLPSGEALYVHHKRIPVYLLPELKDRNFDFRVKEISDNEVFLLIFRS